MRFGLLCLALVVYGVIEIWSGRPVRQPPGILAADEPRQEDTPDARPIQGHPYPRFTLTPLADFEVRARVLSREHYRWDASAKLAPVDLALGWGPMSDSSILDRIELWQDGRWYQFRGNPLPLPAPEMLRHSANMHIIPADRRVERSLRKVRAGQVVHLRGKLVQVTSESGFAWRSSMTRLDQGSGACEVVYVEHLEVQ